MGHNREISWRLAIIFRAPTSFACSRNSRLPLDRIGKPRRRTRPQAEVLLTRVGALARMPADVINGVHAARKHRNNLLHDREDDMDAVTVSQARSGSRHI